MMLFSQRYKDWNGIQLGFSNIKDGKETNLTTIGSHGCCITSIGMLAELTPDRVNDLLKSVNGYQTNLVIWLKVGEAIKSLKFIWRGTSYDDAKVKDIISKQGACLVEVDGKPIGGTKHWVLAIGDGKIQDPWDGKVKPFSTYTPTGYAEFEVIKQEDTGALEACLKQHTELVTELEAVKTTLNVLIDFKQRIADKLGATNQIEDIESRISTLIGVEDKLEKAEQKYTKLENEKKSEAAEYEKKVKDMDDRITNIQNEYQIQLDKIKQNFDDEVDSLRKANTILSQQVADLQKTQEKVNKIKEILIKVKETIMSKLGISYPNTPTTSDGESTK